MVNFLSKALSTLAPRKRSAKNPTHRGPATPKNAKPSTAEEPEVEIETIENLEDKLVESPVSTPKERAEPVTASVKAAIHKDTVEVREPAGNPSMTEERRTLIHKAMAVQRTKSKLLDELSPEQRKKLRILAGKALLGE